MVSELEPIVLSTGARKVFVGQCHLVLSLRFHVVQILDTCPLILPNFLAHFFLTLRQ